MYIVYKSFCETGCVISGYYFHAFTTSPSLRLEIFLCLTLSMSQFFNGSMKQSE